MIKIFIQRIEIIFYSTLVFFILLFLTLTFDTINTLPKRDHRENLTDQVLLGKALWEKNHCIGCHTLLGEGAYYGPELGNVYKRRGGDVVGEAFIKAWLKVTKHVAGRRQMPQFNLNEEEIEALIAFFKWTSEINTENWPPNLEG
ncbi:Nitric-oxide reductase subunit C [Beggiatoa sp. PS]|nr:Nitric-oxide reductase subunit C [Beggiatoa sp. PS]